MEKLEFKVAVLTEAEIIKIIDKRINEITNHPTDAGEYLNVQELADMLKRSKNTVHRWCCYNYNEIPFRKNGARLIFQREEITQWAKSIGIYRHPLQKNKAS
jgi:hypothetical protein